MKVSKTIEICLDYHRSYSKPNTIRAYASILTRFGLIFGDKELEEISDLLGKTRAQPLEY